MRGEICVKSVLYECQLRCIALGIKCEIVNESDGRFLNIPISISKLNNINVMVSCMNNSFFISCIVGKIREDKLQNTMMLCGDINKNENIICNITEQNKTHILELFRYSSECITAEDCVENVLNSIMDIKHLLIIHNEEIENVLVS